MVGLLVDLTKEGINTLRAELGKKEKFSGTLVVALSPACPTRKEDLLELLNLRDEFQGDQFQLQLRLLPLPSGVRSDARYSVIPPSSLLLRDSASGESWIWMGSNGDLDTHRPYHTASLNVLLLAPPLVADLWRRQFDYITVKAAPLKPASIEIPHLVPAPGEIEAAKNWADYCIGLYRAEDPDLTARVEIDPKTGEVTATTADGQKVPTASAFNNITALPPELKDILAALSHGSLVSVDESTRVKPLAIPVKSFLFGKESVTNVGTVKHSQSFSLELLEEKVAKEIERCRKITPTVALLSFSPGQGMHWIPETAKPLLQAELDAMESAAKQALGGISHAGVEDWIKQRWPDYERDLCKMYLELNRGIGEPPRDRIEDVKQETRSRLDRAISGRLVPKVSYAGYAPAILDAAAASVSGLGQIVQLLRSAATKLREPYSEHPFFDRNFTKRTFTSEQWENVMNVLGDTVSLRFGKLGATQASDLARVEIGRIEEICNDTALDDKARIKGLWTLIRQSPAA
jgi:hypothetical protein